MLVRARAWGFIRTDRCARRFGVRVAEFGTGGSYANPLDNDVDAGDEAANVEFCPVFASQPSSGTLTVSTDGTLGLVGAAGGTYVIPYTLYTFTPGGTAAVNRGASSVTIAVGSITAIGQASESNAAQALASSQRKALVQAAETDTAQAFATVQRKAVGQANESDSAQPIAYSAPGTIGQVLENDAAQPIVAKQARAIGQASETDAAQTITAGTGTAVTIGLALEIDTAGAFVALGPIAIAIGQALEIDAARAMTSIGGDVSIDPATIRRVARSPALTRLARSSAMVRSTNGL